MAHTKSNRLIFLDNLRGIAAIMVVLQHSLEFFFPTFEKITKTDFNLGQIGVLIFFLISGFIIPFSFDLNNNTKKFIFNRIFRIFPLYLFVFFIQFTFFVIYYENNFNYITKIFISHLFLVQEYLKLPNLVGGSWTLFLEFLWYFTFIMISVSKLRKNINFLAYLFSFGLIAIGLISIYLNIRIPLGRFCLIQACLLGYIYYEYYLGKLNSNNFYILNVLVLFTIFFSLGVSFYYFKSEYFSFKCVLISYIIGFVIFHIGFISRKSELNEIKFLNFMGEISYSLYLIHGIILTVLSFFESKSLTLLIPFYLTTILISIITYFIIEKKGIDLGKRIFKKINTSQR